MVKPRTTWLLAILIPAALTLAPALAEETVVRTDGLWRQEGYGTLLEIEAGKVRTYQITSASCVRSSEGYDRGRQLGKYTTVEVDSEETRLTLRALDGNVYYFVRQECLPEACEEYQPTADPVANFEIFWRSFEENYPFFDVHDVDWRDTYDRFRPRVNEETTEDELFAILVEMVEPLEDAHVGIEAGERQQNHRGYALTDKRDAVWRLVRRKYLAGNYTTQLEWLQHGWLNGRTAYLRVRTMTAFSLYDRMPVTAEVALVEAAMSQVIADLHTAEKLIIDVRFNTGGDDMLARTIAGFFADEARPAYSKRARVGGYDEFAAPQEFKVEPGGLMRFTKPIVVLMNGATVSAAEIFLQSMEPLPHVTFIGEPSEGAYSDILLKELPNGWTFWFGNELYTNHEGKNYEGTGQQPDILVPLTIEDLEKSRRDVALERAIEE